MTGNEILKVVVLLRGFGEITGMPDAQLDLVVERAKQALAKRGVPPAAPDPPDPPGPP